MLEYLFLLCFILVGYIYIGYPLCAMLLSRLIPKPVQSENYEPTITIIISAYNEELHIAETIENKLQQDYPVEKLNIIVVSDESTDRTDIIVQGYKSERLMFLRQHPRQGKTAALNMARMPTADAATAALSPE